MREVLITELNWRCSVVRHHCPTPDDNLVVGQAGAQAYPPRTGLKRDSPVLLCLPFLAAGEPRSSCSYILASVNPTGFQMRVFLYDTLSALILLVLEGIPFLGKNLSHSFVWLSPGWTLSSGGSLWSYVLMRSTSYAYSALIPTTSQWKGPGKIKHPFYQDSDSLMLEIKSTKWPTVRSGRDRSQIHF